MVSIARVEDDALGQVDEEMSALRSDDSAVMMMVERSGMGANAGAVDAIERAIQERIGAERFDLWFERKTRLRLEETGNAGHRLRIEAANAFAGNWIRTKFADEAKAAAQEILECEVEVIVEVRAEAGESHGNPTIAADEVAQTNGGQLPQASEGRKTEAANPARSGNAGLNPKYMLEEFVVGPSNQMAYHAAVRVADQPGKQFNPLFIHGHCGLGKTHLLQGICQRFARKNPGKKWLYLTAEQFTNEFLEAIKTHKTDAFRRRLRHADLLVIDDVHFLAHKKATQEEFLHTFNQIDAGGKQVVLASDSAPKQIASLAESLVSRFVSGMVLRIDTPDLPTRLEILRRRVARNGWQVSDSILMHIAQSAAASVRELEGMLLQVMAGMSLVNRGDTDAAAVVAGIKNRSTSGAGPIAVECILRAVSEMFGIENSALMGSSRQKNISTARAVAMYLARQHTGMSFPEIGRAMGNKNHSTVIAACQRVEALIENGTLVCWKVGGIGGEVRHQAMADLLHALENAVRRK